MEGHVTLTFRVTPCCLGVGIWHPRDGQIAIHLQASTDVADKCARRFGEARALGLLTDPPHSWFGAYR
jgi:hypothetical protein